MEADFIKRLEGQGYERVNITNEAGLIANLRQQLEKLNDYTFTTAEWERFFRESISGANDGIVEKTRRIHDDPVQNLTRDDGSTKNIKLLDKKCIHNNRIQVLNQYEETGGTRQTRYQVGPQALLLNMGHSEEEVLELIHSVFSAVRIPPEYGGLDAPIAPLNISRELVNRFVGENYTLLP